MKTHHTFLATTLGVTMIGSLFAGDVAPVATKENKGTFSGRVQFLGMHRDYDDGNDGHASTLGIKLGYQSAAYGPVDFGFAYNYAATLFDGGNTALLANDDIHVLNEAWVRYALGEDTTITAGRQVLHGEVFRIDDARQKARAVEAIKLTSKPSTDSTLTVGHAIRLSNWIDAGDRWQFNDFGDVLGTPNDTDGLTWFEASYTGIENLEVSVFDAYAWDVANLFGTRIQYDFSDETSVIAYYRHESDVGDGAPTKSDVYGISLRQKVGQVTLEPGYFSVTGDNLKFQETTTGINHPLGASMMIRGGQFNGGADTAFLKATTSINKTKVYALYNYTWQCGHGPFDCHEFNVVVKHPIMDNLTVAFKGGVAERFGKNGNKDNVATDARLFLTYTF